MVVIHRPIRRLKDTFQYTRSYDESRRIKGRRLLSTKTHPRLPFNHSQLLRMFQSDKNYFDVRLSRWK